MAFVATAADGSTIHYQDGKRYLWLASLSGPLIPMLAIALYFWSDGNLLTMFFPLAYPIPSSSRRWPTPSWARIATTRRKKWCR